VRALRQGPNGWNGGCGKCGFTHLLMVVLCWWDFPPCLAAYQHHCALINSMVPHWSPGCCRGWDGR
jgi:hypothetical protein